MFCSQYHPCYHSFIYGFCTLVGRHFAKPLYVFFVPNLEKFQEFYKLMGLLNTKGNKLCRNMKTIWISMFFLAEWVFVEYHLLIMKLHVENANNNATSRSIWIFFVMLILLKGCFVSSLCSNVLYTYQDCIRLKYICVQIDFIKLTQQELSMVYYVDPYAKFEDSTFDDLNGPLRPSSRHYATPPMN
jgi:hypothetical protein